MTTKNPFSGQPHRAKFAAAAAFSLALGLAIPGAQAADSPELFPAPVYVTLQASDATETLPAGTLLEGLDSAHYIAVGPAGRHLLVGSRSLPEAWLLDAHSGEKLASFAVGPGPQGVAISPDGRRGLVVSSGDGTIAVLDLRKHTILKSIAVGKTPHNVRFTADGKLAYVTLQGEGRVAVVDMRKLEKTGKIPVPGLNGPHNLDLSADGETLWVRDLVGKVAVLDLRTGKELALIPVGLGHAGIDVIPGGRLVFTGAIADHRVSVIDASTYEVVKQIDVGKGPHGLHASRDGRWVYVAVTGGNKIAVIDTKTLTVAKQLDVHGKLPFWLAVAGSD